MVRLPARGRVVWFSYPPEGVLKVAGTRVGIVTIVDDTNYGNRLQNFALQRAVFELGYHPETLVNHPPRMSRRMLFSRAVYALLADGPVTFGRRNVPRLLRRIGRRGSSTSDARLLRDRRAAIAHFAEESLEQSKEEYSKRPAAYWGQRYGAAIVGSDQVWNPGFRNAQDVDFLTFMPPSRRIAYSASFGVPTIPHYLTRRYRAWLSGIPFISVREERAAEIVRDMIGRDVPVVVDPTLLFPSDAWQTFAQVPAGLDNSSYAVRFFLGAATPEQESFVQRCAEERGVQLLDLGRPELAQFWAMDPRGFVGALSRAEFVATDSFHASVFSLMNHRPLILRSRDETDVRVQTLLKLHGIVASRTDTEGLATVWSPDWQAADKRIAAERVQSWKFLSDSLAKALTDSAP